LSRLKVLASLVLITAVHFSEDLKAQVSVGGGGGSCMLIVGKITQHWSDAKRAMLPFKAKLNRAKREHFYCVSPEYIRSAIEKRVSMGMGLRCFTDPEGIGLGLCCDDSLRECARLRPDVVPESLPQQRKETTYRKSNSDWVKPPSDKDQW